LLLNFQILSNINYILIDNQNEAKSGLEHASRSFEEWREPIESHE